MKNLTMRVVFAMLPAGMVFAGGDDDTPGECPEDLCGAPDQSGGGGGGGGGSILINNTDLGDSYQYSDDYDNDGIEDDYDNCPFATNLDQADADGDGFGTACDACPAVADADQVDADGDGAGDACDSDSDNDGIVNVIPDNCLVFPNPTQMNHDGDILGDACDTDDDGDGVGDADDNCPLVANPGQANEDPDVFGDACDDDYDGDLVMDSTDNCLTVVNPDQANMNVLEELAAERPALGDLCDPDMDGDGVVNIRDNCPGLENAPEQIGGLQPDEDRDFRGDACDDYYCFVVDVEANCLDPDAPFTAYAGDRWEARTGEEMRLHLYANRENASIRYSWTIVEAPEGSDASIEHPEGAAAVSTPYEYHYLADRVVTFTPDVPGDYVIEVRTELAMGDELFPDRRTSTARTTVTADGAATDEGGGFCALGGSFDPGALAPFALAVFGLMLVRRRPRMR